MRLTLSVNSYCNQPTNAPNIQVFDSFPVYVGRSADCSYTLDDAFVSSRHAVITLEGNQLVIEDTSTNGLFVNEADDSLGKGRSQVLSHMDSLEIGDYIIHVGIEQSDANVPSQDTDGYIRGAQSNSSNDNAKAKILDKDPFDDSSSFGDDRSFDSRPSFGDSPSFGDDPSFGDKPSLGVKPSFGDSPSSANNISFSDDTSDWDFNALEPEQTNSAMDIQGINSAPVTEVPNFSSSREDDTLADWPCDNDDANPVNARNMAPFRTPGEVSTKPNSRPNSKLEPAAAPQHKAIQHETNAQASQPPNSGLAANHTDDAIQILLRAASLRQSDFDNTDNTEVLEQTGRLLAQMVNAMMLLLRSRTELKNEARIDLTMVARSGNNPLKTLPSAQEALTRLLTDGSPTYQQSDKAIKEAIDDLQEHQIALLEGMQSTVNSLMLKFDPEKLAEKLEKKGGIVANIPVTRQAKLWEMFCEQYDFIREEALSDFNNIFGDDFRKAYEMRTGKKGRDSEF